MKKQSPTVIHRGQSDSQPQRHLPLVDILVNTHPCRCHRTVTFTCLSGTMSAHSSQLRDRTRRQWIRWFVRLFTEIRSDAERSENHGVGSSILPLGTNTLNNLGELGELSSVTLRLI